jgi:hypothetical protein
MAQPHKLAALCQQWSSAWMSPAVDAPRGGCALRWTWDACMLNLFENKNGITLNVFFLMLTFSLINPFCDHRIISNASTF